MITLLTGGNHYQIRRELTGRLAALGDGVEVSRLSAENLSANDLPQLLTGLSLFSTRRAIVLRDISSDKVLWERLGELLDVVDEQTELLIIEPAPDKRTKTYKKLQKLATIIEFGQPGETELISWLQNEARRLGANLEPEVARFLIHYVGSEQAQLANELEKLALADNSITRQLVEAYCEPIPQASAFEVIDAVVQGRRDKLANDLMDLSHSEDPYKFFGLLSSQLGALAACSVAGQRSAQQIAKDCGLHPYVAQKSLPLARRLGVQKVKQMIELLADCDRQMKSSRGEPWQLIELTVMKMTMK